MAKKTTAKLSGGPGVSSPADDSYVDLTGTAPDLNNHAHVRAMFDQALCLARKSGKVDARKYTAVAEALGALYP